MALGIWSDLPKSPPVSPSVLVDTEGGLMVDVANGLLQKRNDRPVNLAE